MRGQMKFGLYIPTRLLFGAGELNQLATAGLPGKKALLVVSAGGSMARLGYLDRVRALLAQGGAECAAGLRVGGGRAVSGMAEPVGQPL